MLEPGRPTAAGARGRAGNELADGLGDGGGLGLGVVALGVVVLGVEVLGVVVLGVVVLGVPLEVAAPDVSLAEPVGAAGLVSPVRMKVVSSAARSMSRPTPTRWQARPGRHSRGQFPEGAAGHKSKTSGHD